MPITDSNLAGNFISNTYQKILQTDKVNGPISSSPTINSVDILGGKYTVLNGTGQAQAAIVIQDTSSNTNGGLFLQNTGKDPGSVWGIQIEYSGDSSNTPGLNFWRPSGSTNFGNYKLFLKNTGTSFIGYSSSLPNDVTGYSLYTKGGIRIETTSSTNNRGLRIKSGSDTYYPIEIKRFQCNYQQTDNYRSEYGGGFEANVGLLEVQNTGYSYNEWNAVIVGYGLIGVDPELGTSEGWRNVKQQVYLNTSNGNWGAFMTFAFRATSTAPANRANNSWVDLMFIRKEISYRHNYDIGGLGQARGPSVAGSYDWDYIPNSTYPANLE
jgi:hypothetical protein